MKENTLITWKLKINKNIFFQNKLAYFPLFSGVSLFIKK
jgi:hypothetical protein